MSLRWLAVAPWARPPVAGGTVLWSYRKLAALIILCKCSRVSGAISCAAITSLLRPGYVWNGFLKGKGGGILPARSVLGVFSLICIWNLCDARIYKLQSLQRLLCSFVVHVRWYFTSLMQPFCVHVELISLHQRLFACLPFHWHFQEWSTSNFPCSLTGNAV